jgi:ribosome assembly protein YihI (activator of Der GTPase)
MRQVKMATKAPRLGRGLEALLVDVSSEQNLSEKIEQKNLFIQQQTQLLQEAQQLKLLLDTFEHLVQQLEFFNKNNSTLL